MARRLLVVTGPDDVHAVAVAVAAAERGLEPVRVDLADLPGLGLALGQGGGRGARVRLGSGSGPVDPAGCAAAWWRRPAEPAVPEGADQDARRLWEGEWRCALRGLAHVVGGRWVNAPARDETARLKVVQLEAARALGLDVPRTLVTNDLSEARRFLAGCRGGAVLKSLASLRQGGKTRAVAADDAWLPGRLSAGPAILQERIPGLDLRVTVVGRRLFTAAADAEAAGCPDDVRIDWWRAAAAARPVTLSEPLSRRLLALVRRLGLAYGAIDLRRRRDGRWAFLEVNPSGQWLHAEVATGQPITAAVVDLLVGPRGAGRGRRGAAAG